MRWPRRRTVAFGAVVALVGASAAIGLAVAPAGADRAHAVQHRALSATRHALDEGDGSNYCYSDYYGDRLAARERAPQAVTGSSSDTTTRTSTPAKTGKSATAGTSTLSNAPSRTDTATPSRTPTKTAADPSGTDAPAQTSTSTGTSTATDAATETGSAAGPTDESGATGDSTDAVSLDAYRFAPLESPSDPSGDGSSSGYPPPPAATDDNYDTPSNTELDANVLDNDSEDAHHACLLNGNGPTHGTLTFRYDGTFTYQPVEDYVGSDTFSYEALDDYGQSSDPKAVTIDVQPPAPTAMDDYYYDKHFTSDEAVHTVSDADGVLNNDTPVDGGGPLMAEKLSDPSYGTVELDSNGGFTYTPDAGFTGDDSFTYHAYQVFGAGERQTTRYSASATVYLEVEPPDPKAVDDTYSVNQGGVLAPPAAEGVQKNDVSGDGGTLYTVLEEGGDPKHGMLDLQPDGSFTYTPDSDYVGPDSFQYYDYENRGEQTYTTNVATVTITVTSADLSIMKTAPTSVEAGAGIQYSIAVSNSGPDSADNVMVTDQLPAGTTYVGASEDCSYSPSENGPGVVTCSAGTLASNDGMPSFTIDVTAPDDGSVSVTNTASVSSTTSDPDPDNNTSTATTAITSTPAPQPPPTAANDAYTTPEGTQLTVPAPGVLVNDSAPSGGPLHTVQVSTPTHGTVVLSSNGAVSYLPNAGFVGTDTFTYRASDGQQLSNLATVTISVTRTVTPPASKPPTHPVTKTPTTPPPVTQPPVTPPPVTQPPVTTGPNTPDVTSPPAPPVPTNSVETPDTTVPTQPTQQPSTPKTNPPASGGVQSLRLTAPSVIPGGPLRATGLGCAPNNSVQLTIAGRPAGSGTADAGGRFAVPVTTTGLKVGTYSVTATCGNRQLVANVALVYVTANSNAPTAQALVVAAALAFFLLLLGLIARRPI